MIHSLLRPLSASFFAWWLLFVLSPTQTGGPPSENVRRSAEDSITRQTQDPAETTLYFPDYVDGGGWSVQLVLSNVDPAAAEVRAEVYDPEGQPVLDLFDSELTLEVPALGSRVLRSSGTGAIRRGWIQVRAGTDSVSGLLTYRHAQSGIEVGVKPVELGPEFALFVEESTTVGAGVAVFKPDSAPRLELRIRDEEGNDPLEGGFVPWADFRQEALTLPEWFAVEGIDPGFLDDFRGLLFLETEDESPFAPLGLRFRKRSSSLSAVPAIRTQHEESQEMSLVFPDYVDGGGWSVQLVLSNVDPDAAAKVRVEVYDPEGQPVRDLFDSDLKLEIPALGGRVLRSTGAEAIRRGWIQVEADAGTISGLLAYRHAQSGVEVGVEPAQLGKQFALFVEESGTVGAGLALFKPDPESGIELRLRDEEGDDPLNGLFLAWKDFQQEALTLPEWFDVPGVDADFLRDFRGLLFLRTEDESGFAPLGLRFGKGTSSLSAVPMIQIPDGAGIEGGQAPPPTVKLSASPTSIERGQSTMLTWSSTSAESAEITPDIGPVSTSGSRKVSPNVTTTYHIMVTGADGQTATASVTVTVSVSERAVLMALHQFTGGPDWLKSRNWGSSRPLRYWHGVIVDDDGRVTELELGGNGLTGPIPSELVNLSNLERLNLENNDLAGAIPPELGNLSNLEFLILGNNRLTGRIPPELGNLSNLIKLTLSQNRLAGPIPPELGNLSNLEGLSLISNKLTGPIPTELGNLSNLEGLSLRSNKLTGPIPPELGNLSNLKGLDLSDNELTGPIPPELGNLTNLKTLYLNNNHLTGPLPSSFLDMDSGQQFWLDSNYGLCVPGSTSFVRWSKRIPDFKAGAFCNDSDRAILNALHEVTGGSDWPNSSGWRGDGVLGEWYGVSVDSLGRVTELDLSHNGLRGRVPGSLALLSQMAKLKIDGNSISGRLPMSLSYLRSLREFHYADTKLCVPTAASFRDWLNTISSHEGTGVKCAPLTDRDILVALYDATQGANWFQSENWLTKAGLKRWHGVSIDGNGRVIRMELRSNYLEGVIPPELGFLSHLEQLDLAYNELTGPIPPALGRLSRLNTLYLLRNQLTGPIPSEFGNLSRLTELDLQSNQLTGPIPPALGRLSRLHILDLPWNQLTGPIPSALGNLSSMYILDLSRNQLSGPIPSALGNLSSVYRLDLSRNQLSGPIPSALGRLEKLKIMSLTKNVGLAGPLPARLANLRRLEELLAGGTGLCVPSTASIQRWLESVWKRRIVTCLRDGPVAAYLTQAVQSREFPVPLVAGEDAVLRVFMTAAGSTGKQIPLVRAKFYVRGRERHVLDIPGKSAPIPTKLNEGSLSASVNAEIPGEIVQPGLEMIIEIDPEKTLGSATRLPARIPETGRQAVEVRSMPTFDLTLIPFLWRSAPDKSIVGLVEAMAEDPAGHELLWHTRTLLPIEDLKVTAHEPVVSSSNSAFALLSETEAIRALEGAGGYYMGMMSGPVPDASGVAIRPGKSSFSIPVGVVMAHELGHNWNLRHAPCGGAMGTDPSFPQPDGSTGAWGYDFRFGGRLVPPERPDLMGNCYPQWISDYHFTNAFRYRLHTVAMGGQSSLVAAPATSLLLWGGVDGGEVPFLEPAFVVQAPASLPRTNGEYEIVGQSAAGNELFSFSFEMPQVADGDGSSSFAFVLPAQPDWADQLDSITLTGPGGSTTLDQDTDQPVTILRNPRNGQIRAILRGAEAAPQRVDATVSTLSLDPGLERLTSRGIPDPESWTQ